MKIEIVRRGTVHDNTENNFGYSGWPSVAWSDNGELLAVFSGDRLGHVCPFGKVLLRRSSDEGRTWSTPEVVVDTPLDDRDAGVTRLGDGRLLVTTFNNTRAMQREYAANDRRHGDAMNAMIRAYCEMVTDAQETKYYGALAVLSDDNGYSWSEPFHTPVSAPHGAVQLTDGRILYAGTAAPGKTAPEATPILVAESRDGRTWKHLASVGRCPELTACGHYEPHLCELKNGHIVLTIRHDGEGVFTVSSAVSEDGGKTWTTPKTTGANGSPPHLLLHSSGKLVMTYGRRKPPYGVEAQFSEDGAAWSEPVTIWDGGVDGDLGYPCSVELEDGNVFTLYYAKPRAGAKCAILSTTWRF